MNRRLGFACFVLIAAATPALAQQVERSPDPAPQDARVRRASGPTLSVNANGMPLGPVIVDDRAALEVLPGVRRAGGPDVKFLRPTFTLVDEELALLGLAPRPGVPTVVLPLGDRAAESASVLRVATHPAADLRVGGATLSREASPFVGGTLSASDAPPDIVSSTAASAAPIGPVALPLNQSTGLNGMFTMFDFNGLPLTVGADVSNLYAASGITFAGAFYGPPDGILYGFFTDAALYNYGTGQISSPEITIRFAQRANGVAFNYASVDGPSTLTAWLNGVAVGTVDVPSTVLGSTSRWWGFEFTDGRQFDRLTIAGSPRGFGLDNLQVSVAPPVAVPEPGMAGLLAIGLASLVALARRRRSH